MDFTGRSSQPPQPANTGSQFGGNVGGPASSKKSSKASNKHGWQRWGMGALGLLVVLLVAALIVAIGFGGPKNESTYVDSSKLQAVFLNTGQVYFGNLKSVNDKYFVLDDIYYLQTNNGNSSSSTNNSNSNTSVSLVKLGCELHAPYDQMVINRTQVTFWENLQSDGQVAKAVATFQKDNPNGQKCADQSSANNAGGVQNTSSSSNTNSTSNTSSTSKQ